MRGYNMNYFILRPEGNTPYALASRRAMKMYAVSIREVNPELSKDMMDCANKFSSGNPEDDVEFHLEKESKVSGLVHKHMYDQALEDLRKIKEGFKTGFGVFERVVAIFDKHVSRDPHRQDDNGFIVCTPELRKELADFGDSLK